MSHVHSGHSRSPQQVDSAVPSERPLLRITPPQETATTSTCVVQSELVPAITLILGEEAIAFLRTSGATPPSPPTQMSAILYGAAHAVKDPTQRDAILHLRELYDTAVDFEDKLAKPRSPLESASAPSGDEVTHPEGESVSLINAALTAITERFNAEAHVLTTARDAIELARAVAATDSPSPAPSAVHVEIPVTPPQAPPTPDEHPSTKQRKDYLATLTLGSALIGRLLYKGLGALAIATARLREVVPSIKSIDRPEGRTNLLKRVLDSIVEFDIRGLESFASTALGMLAPRGMSERFAQTGVDQDSPSSPEGESTRRKALLKFIIDLSKIRSYFRRNPQIRDGGHWFYAKEPQVLLDREGKFARLDSFLLSTTEGRKLFDAIYQQLAVTSDTEDGQGSTITVPVLPLTPTTLPLPPRHFITSLEYLDARGEPIDQPDQNHFRACIAGGALVTTPAEARLVRYTHDNVHTPIRLNDLASCRPRALTAQEFQSFRKLLPSATFDLGEQMEVTYELIRQFNDPKDRFKLAGHVEACRGWSYTMDPLIRSFQHAAGDAFLESVYHSRAGICDSMSAVASYLVGEAIGLPALVVSGPVAEGNFFDRKVGHSIALALLPDGVQTFDLTVASSSNSRITGHRVPIEAREALFQAVSRPTITRREIASLYRDLGNLIRGKRPSHFNAHLSKDLAPVRLWRDRIASRGSEPPHDHKENFPSPPSNETVKNLQWGVEVIQFDRLLARCERADNFDEFGWFLAYELGDLHFEPAKGSSVSSQAPSTPRGLMELINRDISTEATQHLFSLTAHKRFSHRVVQNFPTIAKSLSISQIPRFVECLREHNYPEAIAAEILNNSIERAFEHARYLVKSGSEIERTIQFARTTTLLLEDYSARGFPCSHREAAEAMVHIFHAAKHSAQIKGATANEIHDLSIALIDSLRALWKAADSQGPTRLCDAFMDESPALRGLEILQEREPALLHQALHLDRKNGRDILTTQVVRCLVDQPDTPLAASSLIRSAARLMGSLDLSANSPTVRAATKQIISTYLKDRSEIGRQDDPLINWPDDHNPASTLSFIADRKNGGAPAISLLKLLIEHNGISLREAQSFWPCSKERQVAERFVRACDFESGGVLSGPEDYEWRLSELPNLLNAIISQSSHPRIARTTQEILDWTRARGELHARPEEKHFLETLTLLGGVPHEWHFDDQEPQLVEALIELTRGSMPPATLFAALHAIAPYIIAPTEEAQGDKHEAWLTELARRVREGGDDTAATALLAGSKRWTQRSPRHLAGTIEGCAVACTVADLACQCALNLPALTGAIPFTPFTHVSPLNPDDGTSPHTQLWSACFPLDASYPYYDKPKSLGAAALLRDIFNGLSTKTRHTLRSPLLHFTSSEQGKVKVSGFAGNPESSRPYLRGDDVRFIDWKRSARAGTFMIKVREEREERALTIVADLGTLGHETIVAEDNNLQVDLVLTHHTVIRHYRNVAKNILAFAEDSDHFWMGIQNDAKTAQKLRADEENLFGPNLFQTGSPLAYGQIEIPRKHLIHFLMGPDCEEAMQRSVPLLRARGNMVAVGPLPPFRKS